MEARIVEDDSWNEETDLEDEDAAELITVPQSFAATPSQWTEFANFMPSPGGLTNFSFHERGYLRAIYDSSATRKILMAGRQVEKTVPVTSKCLMANGELKEAGRVVLGDQMATMLPDHTHMGSGSVSWVSRRYWKRCLRIFTRQGHVAEVAGTHPMRQWDQWTEASKLKVGDRLAAVRKAGEFIGSESVSYPRIRLTAYLLGDGCIGPQLGFTSLPGRKLDEFLADCEFAGEHPKIYSKAKTEAVQVRLSTVGNVSQWMREDGLWGSRSADKFIPRWVFFLDRAETSLFLNRLWATDGTVKNRRSSQYEIAYCSISETLVLEVQSLLWKFGIPSRIRKYVPNLYKGTDKVAYLLRVETADGVRRFLSDVGALGKSESIALPTADSNNNRDTYPKEVNHLITGLIRQIHPNGSPRGSSLHHSGLRRTLKYPPTNRKLWEYTQWFRAEPSVNQALVARLEKHLDTDLYWDEITSIEDLGDLECVDFEVEGTHNFVTGGLVTHNSTLLGNMALAYTSLVPGFRVLYVSPSHQQTKVFSRDRIKEPIETSAIYQSLTNQKLTSNVLEKKFINRSQITMRFAFLNADRTRGIPADAVDIDEFQDVLLDNIPVIEECASHSQWKLFTYSGTPKTLDNSLEHYWSEYSTQNEWVVPCKHHGTPNDPGSWHWNVLDEENIGKKGLICDACGNLITARDPDCQWAALNPKPRVEKPFEGYRIPQLMVPWIEWSDILDKWRKYSRAKFHNEVLGRSFDSGTKPLTVHDMQMNADSRVKMANYEKVGEKYGAGSPIFMGVDWGCHDDKTRILTRNGFKYFCELSDTDEVAQFDQDTRIMSFTKPIVRTVRDWDGELLHFKNRTQDMMLTHTHRMLTKGQGATKWHVETAGETVKRAGQVHLRGSVIWQGEEQGTFTLPGLPSSAGYSGCSPRAFLMDDWLQFLGYYLSEGGLCLRRGKSGVRPYCLKMSQRETVNPETTEKIRKCLARLKIEYSEFPNAKTGDVNWTICGKQFWNWVDQNVGPKGNLKRIPREFLSLSRRQLKLLFGTMMEGDGNTDPRPGNFNGTYSSTSSGLCEDFQELCIRLGMRATLSLQRKAKGNRKSQYRVNWSAGDDHAFNNPSKNVKRVPYKGNVYCCKVPTGFIITERNGRIAYQGNTGENTYTVVTLGGYMPWAPNYFTYFYMHRFEGLESDPRRQIEEVIRLARQFNVATIGVDYGGGHYPNDELVRTFGADRVKKYQWVGNVKEKVKFDPRLGVPRFLCHRTEVMSDVFNAIKRGNVFRFPCWEDFERPYAYDFLNIFSEFNDRLRMNIYKHAPGMPDDTAHSVIFCFLASFFHRKRADVVLPKREVDRTGDGEFEGEEEEEWDIDRHGKHY